MIDGRFRIDGRIDAGGMGVVFRATQLSVNRSVALKVLRKELVADETSVQRFIREASSVSRLSHPNIVTLLDFGHTQDGLLYLAMELIEGVLLSRRIREDRRLLVPDAVAIAAQILDALDHAHTNGIVHRDLKPSNVMLVSLGSRRDLAKLLDFGVAKLYDELQPDATTTRTGLLVGTPAYMSPEQAVGGTVDGRSDLYSVGLVLYEMLTGSWAFEAETTKSLLLKRVYEEPAKMDAEIRTGIPDAVMKTLQRALERDPDQRFPSAKAMRLALTGEVSPDELLDDGQRDGPATVQMPAGKRKEKRVSDATLPRGELQGRFGSHKAWMAVAGFVVIAVGVALVIGLRDSRVAVVRGDAIYLSPADERAVSAPAPAPATAPASAPAPVQPTSLPPRASAERPSQEDRRRSAAVSGRQGARTLRPGVATLRVRVRCADTGVLCWAAISLDGGDAETTKSASFRTRYGSHTLVAQRDGYRSVERRVKVVREVEDITIELHPAP